MKEVTKYISDDGTVFDTADEALDQDERKGVVDYLEDSDLVFDGGPSPWEIVAELQKQYIITKKEFSPTTKTTTKRRKASKPKHIT